MEAIDQGLWNWLQARRGPGLDCLVVTVGKGGAPEVLAAVAGLAVLVLLGKRRPVSAVRIAATFGLWFFLVGPLRTAIGRERPEVTYHSLEKSAEWYSFPSAHTLGAAAIYFAVALAAAEVLPGRRRRRLALAVAALLALAVGLSRLFVGLCYPSDAIAGWLGGFGLAALLARVGRSNGVSPKDC